MGALFLLVILAYATVALIVVVKTKGWKLKVAWLVGFALLPTFDVIATQIYMHYRCVKDGGVRVYEQVTLKRSELIKTNWEAFNKGDTYRREVVLDGRACNVGRDCWLLPKYYQVTHTREPTRFGVERVFHAYMDTRTNNTLGELTYYGHNNSWLIDMFGFSGWGWGCPSREGPAFYSSLFRSIFAVASR